jgi:CheY-like chemotaxis protein
MIAENGLEAFDAVKAKPKNYFDVILLDINMPIMDGFQAIDKIRQYLKGSKLIKCLSILSKSLNRSLPEDQNVLARESGKSLDFENCARKLCGSSSSHDSILGYNFHDAAQGSSKNQN